MEVDVETVLEEMGVKARRWMYLAQDPVQFASFHTYDVDSLGSVVSTCFRSFLNEACYISCINLFRVSVRPLLLASLASVCERNYTDRATAAFRRS
jgi:hypothetical protein